MKKRDWILCLCMVLLLTGCGAEQGPAPPPERTADATPSPAPVSTQSQPPEPAPALSPAPTGETDLPELLYRRMSVLDEETGIRRTTLDPQGLNLNAFFEIPVFPEDTEGYSRINAYFEVLEESFFSPENDNLLWAWESASEKAEGSGSYLYENYARVLTHTEELLCVSITYEWFMGGVYDYGGDSYTFRTDTGELLKLTDLVEGTEDGLRELILEAVRESEREEGAIYFEKLEEYGLDQFEFYLYEGRIIISFDKYEASYGAYGGFSVELPVELKAQWQN